MRKISFFDDVIQTVKRTGIFAPKINSLSNSQEFYGIVEPIIRHKIPVTSVNLSGNNLDSKAAESIALLLRENPQIEELDLSDNNLGDAGITKITAALKGNDKLKSASFSNNNLGKRGGINALKNLETNPNLNYLDFGGERNAALTKNAFWFFPNRFVIQLASTITQNLSLKKITLTPNAPGFLSRTLITRSVTKNAFLESVDYQFKPAPSNGGWHSRNQNFEDKTTNPHSSGIHDALVDYSTPLLIRLIQEISTRDPNFVFDETSFSDVSRAALKKTRQILLEGLSNKEIIALSNYWHSPTRQNISQKLRDYGDHRWPALFGEKEIPIPPNIAGQDGWKLITRTSPQELKDEGKNLEHCVGSYSKNCVSGHSHIVSVVDAKGKSVSTIEFRIVGTGLEVIQHKSRKNGEPNLASENSLNWLMAEVRAERIKIDFAEIRKVQQQKEGPTLEYRLGMDPLNKTKSDEVFSTFKNKMIPSGTLKIPRFTQNFSEVFLGEITVAIPHQNTLPQEIILPSLLKRDKTPDENLLNKLRSSLQTNANRIFGHSNDKPVVKVSEEKKKIFLSSNEEAAMKNLEVLLAGKFERQHNRLLITGDPLEVRKILGNKAREVTNSKQKGDAKTPSSVINNPEMSTLRDPNFREERGVV